MTGRLWSLSYQHKGLPFALWMYGERAEVEAHAENLGLTLDGATDHIEDSATGAVEYMTGGVQ